ncbi:MAG TPA: hypothetical protein VEX38_01515 [Fimbriimonadaceae bacterium]|nr:hypothetical protein [Fimbriimonadaceae bacterium]
MPKFTDSLRGYAFESMKRDGFRCRYCGLDGTASFENWLQLTEEHLLPKGHPERSNPEFIVCACNFCNCADNRYFDLAVSRGLSLDGLSAEELIEQRRPFVLHTREKYREFWEERVSRTLPPMSQGN